MNLPQLDISYILLFIAFILPGSIAIYAYRLRVPQQSKELRYFLIEAISVSLVIFILFFHFISFLFDPNFISEKPFKAWAIVVLCFIVAPFILPLLYVHPLRWLSNLNFISISENTAFDRFFGNLKKGCFLLVELNDGRLVGGYFGEKSYASAYPDPGHLYIEQLYQVDSQGMLQNQPIQGASIILGPEDYKYVIIIDDITGE